MEDDEPRNVIPISGRGSEEVMSGPEETHRAEPHAHVHVSSTGEHAHPHRHGGEEHSHMHVHTGDGEAVPSVQQDSGAEAADGEEDGWAGYLVTDGTRHRDLDGRHCKHCGDYVELRPMRLPRHPGPYVAEFQHVISQMVHCSFAWSNGNLVSIAEETAQPCRQPGCLSNAEHEARQILGKD